jgi:hypothetical protein
MEKPSQDDLENLWNIVCVQDTPELQHSFTVNHLRGQKSLNTVKSGK